MWWLVINLSATGTPLTVWIYPASQTVVQNLMPDWTRTSSNDRRFALSVARSLHKQLFFAEVDWADKPLRDAMDDVYQFNEIDGAGAMAYELPTCVMAAEGCVVH